MLAEATKTKEEEEKDAKKKRIEQQNALVAFLARRKENLHSKQTPPRIHDERLPMGSPMHFDCKGCVAPIIVPENHLTRSPYCPECEDLQKRGWLDGFLLIESRIDQ